MRAPLALAVPALLIAPLALAAPAPAVAAAETIFADDFSGGLDGWQAVTGATSEWTVADGVVGIDTRQQSSGRYLAPSAGVTLPDQYEVTVRVRFEAAAASPTVNLLTDWRAPLAANQRNLAAQLTGAGTMQVARPLGGGTVCSGPVPTSLNEWHDLTIRRAAGVSVVEVDGERVAAVASPEAGGTVGLGVYHAKASFDAIEVRTLDEVPADHPDQATGCDWTPPGAPDDDQPVLVNQSGYNVDQAKRFTAPLAEDGATFTVEDAAGAVRFEGAVTGGVGDFTDFRPSGSGPYTVTVTGENGTATSVPFGIGADWIERVSYRNAIGFMTDVRCYYGDFAAFVHGGTDSRNCALGVAWRDSHQMSYELPTLIDLYLANPSAFQRITDPDAVYEGLPVELPATTPEIVRLIHWAVEVYLDAEVDHTLLKEQLAAFLAAYPYLEEYIPRSVYERVRDYLFPIWGQESKQRYAWHDYTPHTADLFQTYTQIGTGKGEFPVGHSVLPNLHMYEVAVREGRDDAGAYLTAARDQAAWIIENVDPADPAVTKGQRQGEYHLITGLARFLAGHPEQAPAGAAAFVANWARTAVERSDNLWDFRRYSDERWTIPSFTGGGAEDPNETGNVAGFPAAALAAAQVLGDDPLAGRLREIATAHVDNIFGRNPTGRHASFRGATDEWGFEGVDLGWYSEYQGGAGRLQGARGVLDGSPKNAHYPFHPEAGNLGHSEGWVTFNTAWNEALAWRAADATEIAVVDGSGTALAEIPAGRTATVRLTAPLNLDPEAIDTGEVRVRVGDGEPATLTVRQDGAAATTSSATLDPSALGAGPGDVVTVSYGYGAFAEQASVAVVPAAAADAVDGIAATDLPARVAVAGEEVVSLDGEWSFRTDPAADWDTMTVPGNWDVHDRYANHRGKGWYQRGFETPPVADGERVRLHFGAVYWDSRVWLNGELLGEHHAGYTPFEYDVTDLLEPGENVVLVEADNGFGQGAWWPWGGISRSVSLVTTADVRIDRQEVVAVPDLGLGTAAVMSTVFLSNAGDTDRAVTVTGTLTDPDRAEPLPVAGGTLTATVTVPAGGTATADLTARLAAGTYDLWSVDHPALYRIETALDAGHAVSERFGIRKIELDGTSLLLNGEPVRLSGYNRVSDDRVSGNVEPTALVRRDLDRMKGAGANLTRIMHVPQAPELLDYADEIGLLLISEVPVWGGNRDISPAGYPAIQAELTEMVHRDFNHPSVFAYSVANEIAAHTPVGREYDRVMADFTRALDPTRYVTQVSNSYTHAQRPEDDGSFYMDFVSINMYGDFARNADHAHSLWPDKPVFVSEYSPDSFTFPVTREHLDFRTGAGAQAAAFADRPWLIGWSQWTFNDYRSGYPGTSPNQVRGWGVVDVWGRRKQAYAQVREANAPVAGLRLTGGDSGASDGRVSMAELTPRGAGDAPAHVLRGYRLAWQATDAAGEVVASRIVDLPDIAPGADVLRLPVGWADDGSAVTQRVSLLAPTGHEVAVATAAVRPPAAPSLASVVEAAGAVRVRYAEVPGAESYRVTARVDGEVVATADTVEAFADLTGLPDGEPAEVVVAAVNAAGATEAEPVTATPGADAGALPPRLATVVPVRSGLVLGFSDGRAGGSYEVAVTDARTGEEVHRYETSVRGSTRVDGLAAGRAYELRLRRLEADGAAGAWSEPLTGTTLSARSAPELTAHGVVAGATSAAVGVTPSDGVERYHVRVAGPGTGGRRDFTVERAGVELLPIAGLEPDSAYVVTVRAETATGLSRPWTAPFRTASAAGEAPAAPDGLAVSGAVLSWDAVDGAAGYLVTRAACGTTTTLAVTTGTSVELGPAGRSGGGYTVTSLADGHIGQPSEPVVVDEPENCTVTVTVGDTEPRPDGTVPFAAAGAWSASSLPGPDGAGSLYSNTRGDTATWTPGLPEAGRYEVRAWFPADANTTTDALFTVTHAGGTAEVTVDQKAQGGAWLPLGTWEFAAGTGSSVVLSAVSAGYTRASAVQFVPAAGS
ncbi:glycoside hydrolase family 2 TIM barrel-domain containing protein [Jiangella sp. DSM 45060]|uniref:golvesin C-terminal-like domain-containing protein n=1 Tax=Jiangella sp. DSM 45060 TaxID=1798224 RepID=UPI00087C7405|nr:glycoside hydrolase family 2 TIM barrel-domain containing protein [Jiangella sp. DSM 45060]SDT49439.1 Glycosyl hydrolases family 2 [Jiangella sp. DSM 45060]